MSHLPPVVVGLPVELISWFSVPTVPVPMVLLPQLAPVQVPYSSASWWNPWPPSCIAPLGPSALPPDQSIHDEPVFHHRELLSTIECQSTVMPAGVFAVSWVIAARVSQVARRLVSSPKQLKIVELVDAPVWLTPSVWLTVLKRQMLTKFL